MEIAEGVLRHQRPAVHAHSSKAFGHPGGISAEQLVVLRRPQMAHQTELDDKLVDELLGSSLCKDPRLHVSLDINIQEGGGPAQAGGCPIVFLDPGKIGHIQVLNGFMGIFRRLCDIAAVLRSHVRHLL